MLCSVIDYSRPMFKPKTIHLHQHGAAKVLGEAEAHIMNFIWETDEASVRQVRDGIIKRYKELSFNAVMTIMNRLVIKGLLKKKTKDSMYCYSAALSKKAFAVTVTTDMISALFKDPALFGAASFAEVSEGLDGETLTKLRKLTK